MAELKDLFKNLRGDNAKHDRGLSVGEAKGEGSSSIRDVITKYLKNVNSTITEDVKYYINLYYHDLPIPIPITQFATSVTLSKTIQRPYESAQISLKLPADLVYSLFMDESGMPTTGQYILIKRPADTAIEDLPRSFTNEYVTEFFGIVSNVSQSLTVSPEIGFIGFSEVSLNCTCWLGPAQLGQYRTSAYNIPKTTFKNVPGLSEFLISGKDWNNFMKSEIISGVRSTTKIKESIEKLVRTLMYMRIPESIKSEPNDIVTLLYKYMNDVGYDNKALLSAYLKNAGFSQSQIDAVINGSINELDKIGTAERAKQGSSGSSTISGTTRLGSIIAVATSKEHLPDDSIYRNYLPTEKQIHTFGNLARLETPFFKGGSVWDLIHHTFSADGAIIELFPVFIPDMRTKDSTFKPPNSAVTASLGGTPFIMWRFKPLPPEVVINKKTLNAISKNTKDVLKAIRGPEPIQYTTNSEKNKRFQYASAPLTSATDYGHFIPLNNITELTTSMSEVSRVNAAYVENPILDTDDLTFTGNLLSEPVIDAFDALRHGLKMYDMNYPFQDLLKGDSSAVAEYLYLLTAKQNNYYTGTIVCKGVTELVQSGTWLTVGDDLAQMDDMIGKSVEKVRASSREFAEQESPMGNLDPRSAAISNDLEQQYLNSNSTVSSHARLGSFICYVNEVVKVIAVHPQTGLVEQQTVIQFTRGSWGGFSQTLPKNKVGKIGRI